MPQVAEQKNETLTIRLPQPLAQWLREEAAAEAMNVSEFVRYLLLTVKRGQS